MPSPHSGNPTGIQSPSPQPVGGGVPIFNIPVVGDRGPDLWSQPLKTAADWIAFLAAQFVLVPSGQLLRVSVLTSGTSLVKWPGCRRARVRMVGGGAGGGGTTRNLRANTYQTSGGGGSAGGYAEYFTTTIPATWVYAIGAGGSAGTSGTSAPGNGGNTTFSDGVTTVTAFGGNIGILWSSGSPGNVGQLQGAAPPISTNGTINCSGEPGGWYGDGGSSLLGGVGGQLVFNDDAQSAFRHAWTGAGNPGIGFGAGGSGSAVSSASEGDQSGGAGSTGAIILEEYS